MSQGGGGLDANQLVEQELLLIRLGQVDQSPSQTGGDVVHVRGPGAHDTACCHGGHDVAEECGKFGTLRTQRRDIQPEENRNDRSRDQSRVKQLKPLVRGQWYQARAGYPLDIVLAEVSGHTAGLSPQTPRHRHTRQPPSPPPRRQTIQKHIRRRVIALPRTPQHTSSRREQHKRRQVHPGRQLMQVPRRIHLRPQHQLNPLTRQRRQQPVIQHTRRMHHTTEPKTLRQPRQHPSQHPTIRSITRHNHHLSTRTLQLRPQLHRTLSPHTTTRKQHQLPHPMALHQMPSHQTTQHTRTTRHQHRTRTKHPRPQLRNPTRRHHSTQTRHPHHTRPHHHLLLPQRQHPRKNTLNTLHIIGVHQHQTPRILRLRRPHQTPHRSPRQIHHTTTHINSTPGHHHQPLTHNTLTLTRIPHPRPHPLQNLKNPPIHLTHHTRTTRNHPHNLGPRPHLTRNHNPRRIHPLHLEQRITHRTTHRTQLTRVNRPQHQRLDRRDCAPRLIPHPHRHRTRP